MVNEVILIGRLGRDPELKTTTTGKTVCSASLATSEKINNQEVTTWHDLVAWDKTGELMAQYGRKGQLAYVKGQIRKRSWEKDGQQRIAVEIIVRQFRSLERAPQDSQRSKPAETDNASGYTEENIPF